MQNWTLLDASPGIFICTSSSRPSYTSAQNGRLIYMKDQKCLSYWNGSSWQDLRDSSPVFAGGNFFSNVLRGGASPTYTICGITVPRPCSMALIISGTYSVDSGAQEIYQDVTFDGNAIGMGSYRDHVTMVSTGGVTGRATIPSLGVVPSVSAGSHNIGITMVVETGDTGVGVNFQGAKALGFISLYSTSNSL